MTVVAGLIVVMTTLFVNSRHFRIRFSNKLPLWFVACWCLHSLSFFSSSFVEEEHQTWYFLTTTLHLYVLSDRLRRSIERTAIVSESVCRTANGSCLKTTACCFLNLIVWRCIRSWNQTGDKWSHQHDVKWWLSRQDNQLLLHTSIAIGLLILYLLRCGHHSILGRIILLGGFSAAFVKHVFSDAAFIFMSASPVSCVFVSAAAVFSELGVTRRNGGRIVGFADAFVSATVLLHCVLFRSHNVPLLALMVLHEEAFSRSVDVDERAKTVASYYCLGMASYFCLGNSNSLARIDVAAGYVGRSSYNPVVVGLQLWFHTYAGPCFWMASLASRLRDASAATQNHPLMAMCGQLALQRSLPVAVFVTSTLLQRHHLFIWSVFSPKLLFEGMFAVLFSLVILSIMLLGSIRRCKKIYILFP